ncbi:metal binding domain of Ada-domain-containing protein [Umbelopsis sp. AD052]|nr:metal binding domain of Ada-domain-containing protein [Umbelopsis sp. AD052]
MVQVLLTRNIIEQPSDTFTVSLSENVRDQKQPVRKRRKLVQAAKDSEHSYTANVDNYCHYGIDFSTSLDAIQPVFTSEELHVLSWLDVLLLPHCPADDDEQVFTMLENPMQNLPDLALDQSFISCNTNNTAISQPVISIPSPHFWPSLYKTDEERWQAVLERDSKACGHFVYCVRTTGIFCRPTCPSRRPLLCNVTFYLTNEEAENAGFRSCKRCNPQDLVLPSDFRQMVAVESGKEVIRVAAKQGTKMPSLRYLSNKVGMSSFHFHRVFKARTGVTLEEFRKLTLAQK